LDFDTMTLESDSTYIVYISPIRENYMKNWLDSQGSNGGGIVLRTYKPKTNTMLHYPSVELDGVLLNTGQNRMVEPEKGLF